MTKVAGNAKNKSSLIEAIYQRFFKKYLPYYNQKISGTSLSQDKIIIGQGNSDIRFGNQESNTFVPLAPIGYSDKLGGNVDVISFRNLKEIGGKFQEESVKEETTERIINQKNTGILPLTFKDTLAVAFLEGKAYQENKSLMTYLHNIENALIAKDINNVAKERPNLSAKYVDESGKMRGYILAYEGKEDGEEMIYIADLASDKETKLAGGRLINAFLKIYKENYIDKGNLMPIFIQAREGTSYEIVSKNLLSISRKLGVKLELEEEDSYYEGNDVMHSLWLRPVR